MRKFSAARTVYMMARAKHETICEIEKEVKTRILADNIFMSEEVEFENGRTIPSERILDPNADFMMNEEDSHKYWRICHDEYTKAGLVIPDYLTTPTFESFPALKKAEKDLIEWGYSLMKKLPQYKTHEKDLEMLKERASWDMETRDKMIDLTMNIAV